MAEITDIRIYRVEGTGNLRAYAAVTLDDAYVIHGLRVLEGEVGLWVGMPASKNKRGEFKDIFHPITREARDILVKSVVNKYEEESGEQTQTTEASESPEEKAEEESEEVTQETSEEKVEE